MKKQFVPYEIALKLRNLGFNEECLGYFSGYKNEFFKATHTCKNEHLTKSILCTAPLWQQAFDFILQKYNKHCIPFSDGFQWTFDLRWVDTDDILYFYPSTQFPSNESERIMSDTFEENREKALLKLIEIISEK